MNYWSWLYNNTTNKEVTATAYYHQFQPSSITAGRHQRPKMLSIMSILDANVDAWHGMGSLIATLHLIPRC